VKPEILLVPPFLQELSQEHWVRLHLGLEVVVQEQVPLVLVLEPEYQALGQMTLVRLHHPVQDQQVEVVVLPLSVLVGLVD